MSDGQISEALAINDEGLIVGVSEVGGGRFATLWRDGAAFDLNALIDPASGWTLAEARDVNASGQIVGYGTLNGQTRGFLLSPIAAVPEPGTTGLLSLVAGGCVARRARRRRA